MDIRMLNKNATQNPSTLKPACNILDAIRIIAALMTKRKNPRETTVIGNVRNTRMGFRYIFKSIMTNDTSIAYPIESTETPGIIAAIKKMAKAKDITFTKNFIK